MDISKLSIEYIDGHQRTVYEEDVQKDKIMPFMTIVYPSEGYYELCLEDEPWQTLHHGEGCYMTAPGARHSIVHKLYPGESRMCPRWLRFSVMYDHVLDVTSWFNPPLIVNGDRAKPFIDAIDQLLEAEQLPEHTKNFRKMRISGMLLEALTELCGCTPATLELERIYPAILLVKDYHSQRITVEQMAQACAMSTATFYRQFWHTVNRTPMQYLEDYRIKQAARMLITDKYTLAVIAEKCGYCDEFHLSRNFKKHFGLSPKEYKKQTIL